MWRDVEWHKRLTSIIRSSPIDASLMKNNEVAAKFVETTLILGWYVLRSFLYFDKILKAGGKFSKKVYVSNNCNLPS